MAKRKGWDGLPQAAESFSDDAVFERIHDAIARQELPPGTRLREDQLRQIFDVSRARIRNVLARLAYSGVVLLEPNRGASVMNLSPQDARQNFEARRAIEEILVRSVASQGNAKQLASLVQHVASEEDAEARRDTAAMVRLSGEFHARIAEFSGNPILQKFLRELITREALVILAYERPGKPSCSHHEHKDIVDALCKKDADRAAALMAAHLRNVEERLELGGGRDKRIDFAEIFRIPTKLKD